MGSLENEPIVAFPDVVGMKVLDSVEEEGHAGNCDEKVWEEHGQVAPGDRPTHFLLEYPSLNVQYTQLSTAD